MKISKRWFFIALFCAGLRSVPAQESRATLHGQVLDPQASMVAGATVTVTSEDTQVKHETTTNGQGSWTIPFLNPGSYSLRVSATGFKSVEQAGVVLQTSDSKQMDFTLELGSQSEQLTVTARVPLIDTTSATSGTVITTAQVPGFRHGHLAATVTLGARPE